MEEAGSSKGKQGKKKKKKRLEKKTSPEKDKRKEKNTSSNVIVSQRRKKCVNKNVRTTGIKKYNITTLQTKPRNTEFKRKEVNRGGKKTGSAGSPSVHVPPKLQSSKWLAGALRPSWRLVSYGLALSVTAVFTLVASLCTPGAPAGHTQLCRR